MVLCRCMKERHGVPEHGCCRWVTSHILAACLAADQTWTARRASETGHRDTVEPHERRGLQRDG